MTGSKKKNVHAKWNALIFFLVIDFPSHTYNTCAHFLRFAEPVCIFNVSRIHIEERQNLLSNQCGVCKFLKYVIRNRPCLIEFQETQTFYEQTFHSEHRILNFGGYGHWEDVSSCRMVWKMSRHPSDFFRWDINSLK